MDRRFGGFAFGSYASVSASGFVVISAGDAISSSYGVTIQSNIMSGGFKYIPIAFQDFATAGGVLYRLSATGAVAGDDSVVAVVTGSASGVWSGAVHFIHFGLIVSVPFSFK